MPDMKLHTKPASLHLLCSSPTALQLAGWLFSCGCPSAADLLVTLNCAAVVVLLWSCCCCHLLPGEVLTLVERELLGEGAFSRVSEVMQVSLMGALMGEMEP
jgi:hypothetical protein